VVGRRRILEPASYVRLTFVYPIFSQPVGYMWLVYQRTELLLHSILHRTGNRVSIEERPIAAQRERAVSRPSLRTWASGRWEA